MKHWRSGGIFNRDAREKDWIRAHKWADEQLKLMDKYGTKKECKMNTLFSKEIEEIKLKNR